MTPSATPAPSAVHDFDFLVGTWTSRQRRLKKRLQGDDEWETFVGTTTVQRLPGGVANFDTLVAEAWRPGWVGMSFRVFNPVTNLWSIYWVTNEGGGIDAAHHPQMEHHVVDGHAAAEHHLAQDRVVGHVDGDAYVAIDWVYTAETKEGIKVDVVLEMSGNAAAFRDMIDNMCHGGKIAMLGIPSTDMAIDWNKVIFNMLTIKGIYGREMFETWYKMSVLVQSGLDISPVITHRFDYKDFEKGFAAAKTGSSGKVVLKWSDL